LIGLRALIRHTRVVWLLALGVCVVAAPTRVRAADSTDPDSASHSDPPDGSAGAAPTETPSATSAALTPESATGSQTARAVDSDAPAPDAPSESPTSTEPVTPNLTVARVHFRGNRKVEDDAIRAVIKTKPGGSVNQETLRADVRAIWKTGFFEDVQVESSEVKGGGGLAIVFVLKEKPTISKIYVAGNDEVSLSKINEVLDLKKEQVLDLAKLKKNIQKIKQLYVEKGFYMAEVDYELKRPSPSEVEIWFRCREHAKVEVRRVNFVGNKAISDQTLRDVVVTREGNILSLLTQSGTYREDVFQRDLLLLQAHYWDNGYVQVKVGTPVLELSPDKQSLYITITIDEGPQYRLGKIDIHGDLLEPREFFLARVSVKTGEIFNRSRLSDDLQKLTDFYKDRGYAYVNATPSTPVDEKTRTVDVTFDIQKGELVYFERINIRGNSKTRDKVIRRELRVVEGEPYSQTALDYSKRRVNALGYFEKVDISTRRGSSDSLMEVNVEVSERPTGTFQIGAGFSSVENFIAQAQISQNNFFGRGQSLTVQAQLSSLRQLFLLSFQDLYFLDTKWTFGFNLFKQDRYLYSFIRSSYGGSLTWGYLLGDDLRLLLTYNWEQVGISTGSGLRGLFSGGQRDPIPPGSLANLLRSGLTSSARGLLSFDTRNDRMFPTKGWYNTLSGEVADSLVLFSQNIFTRYEAALRYFYPIWGPFVLRLKLEGGLIASRDARGVPIFERYFVGGIYDIRGFAPRSLGPVIKAPSEQAQDAPLTEFRIGGNAQVLGNAEIEFPLFDKVGIRGVVFTDMGNAFNLEDTYCHPIVVEESRDPCKRPWDLGAYRASWGFGLRWFSPIGPLRFEWGIPFKPLPREQPIVFEFTIGNFF